LRELSSIFPLVKSKLKIWRTKHAKKWSVRQQTTIILTSSRLRWMKGIVLRESGIIRMLMRPET
jgi:hypothetical protein